MRLDWSTLSPAELLAEAEGFQHDNDDGSDCYFDPSEAQWSLQVIDPASVDAFESDEAAKTWISEEIAALRKDGMDSRAALYESMILDGFEDPVIIGACNGRRAIWDGWHRTAIAMVRCELLLAILGDRPYPSPAPSLGAEHVAPVAMAAR